MSLKKVSLFNADGDDSVAAQHIINGVPTGISNMNQNKFAWTNALYRRMIANHWIPEKVSMVNDKITVGNLIEDELEAVKDTLAFLIFLDSYQCLNLPNIADYITSPAVRNLIIIQEFQEVVHSQSYQYILDSLFPMMTREEIYNRWRTNPNLLKRVKFVTKIGNQFKDDPSEENFKQVLAMNFILESVYFYQGFDYFDNLASRDKLVQTDVMIDYIRTDEITHVAIFLHMMKELYTDSDYKMLESMMRESAEHEIEWAHSTYGDKILGISCDSSVERVHYLCNHRMNMFKRPLLFPDQGLKNPYAHLEEMSRGNFFEAAAITEYDRADSIAGWDDF